MIVDLHNDCLLEIKNNHRLIQYLQNNQKYLSTICLPVWTTELKNPLKVLKDKHNLIADLKLDYATNFCIEDLGFLCEKDFGFIKTLKPFYCGICWNNSNKFCGGAYSKGRFSKKGKNLVEVLQQDNIIIDIAHMNTYSFNDFVNITQKPIFCSHTGFCDMVKDCRNLENSQIKTIVESNGLMGLYFVGKYISNRNSTIDDVVKNIDYFVNRFGINNLAIGSDFYGTKDLPYGLKKYIVFKKIKQKLLKLGYKEVNIDQIFATNFIEYKKRAY